MSNPGPESSQIAMVLSWLGYVEHPGWLTPDALATVSGCRNVLRQAFDEMGAIGCFGIPQASRLGGVREFLPVVYVAIAADAQAERRAHRLAWSQGAVPFLVILTPEGIRSCDATQYVSRDWSRRNPRKAWGRIDPEGRASLPRDMTSVEHLVAMRLGVSVGLGPGRRARGFGRVDKLLLDGLRTLGTELIGSGLNGGLPVATANRLLSCCLYLYCLHDRGVLTQEWIDGRGHREILLEGRADWDVTAFQDLMRDLERVFNGGVFEFPPEAMALVGTHHLAFVRRVLKFGETFHGREAQTSFFDIDLSVLRTETLSSVYEMLFENQGEGKRQEDGAFYTPAYLVDYVLAQVDRTCRIVPGTRVVDCAAGSGVFLVGAFRRMLERTLEETGRSHVPLDRSRRILSECIFGIERNEDAANVAAFSLFLTMLDYAGQGALPTAEGSGENETVFPPVIGRSLLVRDLFEEDALPPTFDGPFDVLLGNPPWQKVEVIGPKAEKALAGLQQTRGECVDRERAAELFFWTGHDRFLREGGTFGLVLSAKSFLSPGANVFPKAFLAGTEVTGFANLTHLRRKLFPGAEHPAVAAFGTKVQETLADGASGLRSLADPIWVHYPLLASLPLDASRSPWCLVRDAADVDVHAKVDFGRAEGVFRTLMLRPVDRRMVDYLDDACMMGKIATLGNLCGVDGLFLGGGSSPARTGLAKEKLLGTGKDNDWRIRLGLQVPERISKGKQDAIGNADPYEFDESDLAGLKEPYATLFAGSVVVIPRSFDQIEYVERMFAFNSSLTVLCFKRDGSPLDEARRKFLEAMALYLSSDFARYAAALYGRMWIIDRRRFEVGDMSRLPVPFRSIHDERIGAVLAAARTGTLETEIRRQLGVEGVLAEAVEEYGRVRAGFENGVLPDAAREPPDAKCREGYASTLTDELCRSFTDTWRIDVKETFDAARLVHVVTARFVKAAASDGLPDDDPPATASPATTWFDSLGVTYDPGSRKVLLAKPDLACRWTREQAVSDGRRILACIRGRSAA